MSLRGRIAWSFVLFALVLASFFSGVASLAVEAAEKYLIDNRLQSLAPQLIARHRQGLPVDTPPEVSFFAGEDIPPVLRRLPPGFHDVFFGADEVHAMVLDDGAQRFALVDDQSKFESMETIIYIALWTGFAASLALAILLGFATARRVIAPVTALADAINRNAPPDTLPALTGQDEIGVLARAFAARANELEQFLDRERLFTGDVSHELRTPLTVILGAAEVLSAQLGDRPELLASVERIRRAAADTAERVSALLLLSRAPEKLDWPRTELKVLVEREMARCQPLLRGKPVACRLDAPREVWVRARPELVGIALGNLLGNACQYTDAGTVHVRLEPGHLVIEDSGAGLPDAVQARLFERFVRGDHDAQSGTGLGLSIVKRVVDHLGWTIRLETRPEGGSRFTLSFQQEN